MFCELYGCLSTELNNCPVRLLDIDYALNILIRKRFKIKFVRNIKISADGFRVIIDYYRLVPFSRKCPCSMN